MHSQIVDYLSGEVSVSSRYRILTERPTPVKIRLYQRETYPIDYGRKFYRKFISLSGERAAVVELPAEFMEERDKNSLRSILNTYAK